MSDNVKSSARTKLVARKKKKIRDSHKFFNLQVPSLSISAVIPGMLLDGSECLGHLVRTRIKIKDYPGASMSPRSCISMYVRVGARACVPLVGNREIIGRTVRLFLRACTYVRNGNHRAKIYECEW